MGGPDHVTVVAALFDGMGLSAADSQEVVGRRVYPLQGTGEG